MKKAMFGALLATVAMVAHASTSRNLESSAVVNGTIVLAKDGTVQAAEINDEAKYGKPIGDLVRKAALQWLFYPVLRDGKPVVAKVDCMSVSCSKRHRTATTAHASRAPRSGTWTGTPPMRCASARAANTLRRGIP